MSLERLKRTTIFRQRHQQQQDQQMILETSEAVEELKSKLTLPNPTKGRRQYKRFWSSWGSTKSEEDHEKRRLQNNRLGACCFVHLVGAPQRDNKDMPLLPYQKLIWRMLHERRRLLIKKARGIGLSTLMLYIIAYKCLTEFSPGDRVVIITGIRIETVADLLRRLKLLFQRNFPGVYTELIKQKDTIAILNGVIVEGYPAGHTDSVRGLDRVKLVWIDEGDWFAPAESKAVRSATEAFISKPNSENMYLVLSSTVNRPNGLFAEIEKEDPSIYYKMILPYQYGLEGPRPIYDLNQIEQAKVLPVFSREYESSINRAVALGNRYPVTINKDVQHSMGVDPGFGSSQFGVCVLEYSDEIIKVVFAEQYERSSFNDMLQKVWELYTTMKPDNIYIDGSATEFIEAVKQDIGEDSNWYHIHDKIAWAKNNNLDISKYMKVVPVSFSQEGASMLAHCKNLLEHEDSLIAINSKWDQLITALRGAVAKEYKLDKSASPYSDLTDSFRLACKFFRVTK